MTTLKDISDFINKSIDESFRHEKYDVNFFKYFNDIKVDKKVVKNFIDSSLASAIKYQIEELDTYLNGGSYYMFVKESYEWMGKFRVVKFREFLNSILEDAEKYAGKKRGRKPGSKRKAATADK
jgi:hypothetical protein